MPLLFALSERPDGITVEGISGKNLYHDKDRKEQKTRDEQNHSSR
jgi:hypothetical protein